MWTLALNGTGRHGKFIVIALKCYESVLDGKPILLIIQDGYVQDMRQDHHERHLGSNVESRPPMLPYLLLIKLFFFVALVLVSPRNFGGRIPRYASHVAAFYGGKGVHALHKYFYKSAKLHFFKNFRNTCVGFLDSLQHLLPRII